LNARQTEVGKNDVGLLGRHIRQRFLSGTVSAHHLRTWRAPDQCGEALASLSLIFDEDDADRLRHRDQSM
jgi:hypothetical protein